MITFYRAVPQDKRTYTPSAKVEQVLVREINVILTPMNPMYFLSFNLSVCLHYFNYWITIPIIRSGCPGASRNIFWCYTRAYHQWYNLGSQGVSGLSNIIHARPGDPTRADQTPACALTVQSWVVKNNPVAFWCSLVGIIPLWQIEWHSCSALSSGRCSESCWWIAIVLRTWSCRHQ